MTHTYNITGMTCSGCVAKVKSALLMLGDVTAAEVQLNTPQATITMQRHIDLQTLQNALHKAGNYNITEDFYAGAMTHTAAEPSKTWLQTYKPLLLVFGFITGIALLTAYNGDKIVGHIAMNNFMAGFFLVFAFFKMLDLRGFADSYSSYDLLARRWHGYGFIYPFAELALGIAYLLHWQPLYTNIATIIVMGFSSIGVINSVVNKRKIQCACLGAVFNLPMSTITIIEDLLMVAMAVMGVGSEW
ncbi:cation transporter [Panacibacter sp. DH6]|uniref:Cation transporter n=1 Tax=Panacibacter microcysteis TaxID=2793269 RepID=A0A931GZ55_9BACT|nr:heavy metal-associated domain-containing protein [Panacibacter microcysteis]MBG9378028.1 cation transporter [Panacibacter microcysteis]